jgi:hypothetical protein
MQGDYASLDFCFFSSMEKKEANRWLAVARTCEGFTIIDPFPMYRDKLLCFGRQVVYYDLSYRAYEACLPQAGFAIYKSKKRLASLSPSGFFTSF